MILPLHAQPIQRIVALGDSLTAGYLLSPLDAFPARLEALLKQTGHSRIEIRNAGISGTTTASGPSRFEQIVRTSKPDLLILALGANDGLRGLPVGDAKRNLARVIQAAQQKDIPVLLVGLKMPGLTRYYGDAYRAQFEAMFSELSAHYQVPLVPSMLEGVAGVPALNLSDGLHPNAQGQAIIAATLFKTLEPLLAGRSIPTG
jgi:acyl-CoA thioesterase-1